MKSSKELHQEAADLREKGIFDKSIAVNDEALQAAWAAKDPGDYAENVACLAITRRVRAGLTNNRLELVLAEGEMSAGVKIAREFGKPEDLALPLYQLAEIQEDLGNFSTALA